MTNQKHTKETLKIGDKAWVEFSVDGFLEDTTLINAHFSGVTGSFYIDSEFDNISRESPLDLRRQMDELREALEKVNRYFQRSAMNEHFMGDDEHECWNMVIESLSLTKTKESV